MKRVLLLAGVAVSLMHEAATAEVDLKMRVNEKEVSIAKAAGKPVLVYNLVKPPDTKLSVESGGFFHPLTTPSGEVVTEVGPSDHLHHRGVFLAWVEMHGKQDADFWGWGEHAPKDGRKIVNKSVGSSSTSITPEGASASFPVVNSWEAAGETILTEDLKTRLTLDAKAHIVDLDYTLTPVEDLTLSKWAFSGFCVRTRKDGEIVAESPEGEVKLPNPVHTKPETDWPDKPWYAYRIKLDSGKTIGVAVINHPGNPRTLWHNQRDVRMLNPCIVAPAEVKLKAGQPLRLRYTVVTWDGNTPKKLLSDLHAKLK